MKVPLDTIIVKERVREDIGKLDSLMDSMQRHGQFNPVTITRENELIAGHRRLLAARKLGWQYIDVSITDRSSDIEKLELELEENIHRKDFLPEELLAGYRRLDKLKKPGITKRLADFFRNLFGRIFRRRKKVSDSQSSDTVATTAPGEPGGAAKAPAGASQIAPARTGDPYAWQDEG